MFVRHRFSRDPSVAVFQPSRSLLHRVKRVLRRHWLEHSFARQLSARSGAWELFSDSRTQFGATVLDQIRDCDVINLHWVAGFLDYAPFFETAPLRQPVVWTLHDMNAFTGGCHYDLGCGRYNSGCGSCPQLVYRDPNDISRKIWQRKWQIFAEASEKRLHIVSPSRWLANAAKRSSVLGRYPVSIIPNGLDTEMFAPRGRECARSVLRIPPGFTVCLYIADGIDKKRKGLAELLDSFQRLPSQTKLYFLTVGSGVMPENLNFPAHHLESVQDDRLLSLLYNAADFLAISSLQDNFPNTVLEAMACGIPVVGFDVGGIPDVVHPKETGLLARVGDAADLASQIRWLIDHPEDRVRMGQNARKMMESDYTLDVQARRYLDLYQNLLAPRLPQGRQLLPNGSREK
jgi:glycosyltransferase involved in cell wall biosynthesis